MFWVVQSNLHREEGHARLLAALRRAGSQFAEVQVLPFIDKLVPADVNVAGQDAESLPSLMLPLAVTKAPVFVMGSYKLARIARGCSWTGPGAFLEGLKYTEWAEGWGHENLLNAGAQVMPFCAAHLASVGREVFVRPVADSKEFAGRVFSRGAFYRWIKEAEQEGSQHVPPDTEVLVAKVVRDIHSETRFWVVDGNVVTWSLYKRGGKAFQSEDVDPGVVAFARALATRWCPSPAFVVDVAVTDDGPKVVEANCLSAAGFYAGDMQKLVFALEDYFAGRTPRSGDISKGVYEEVGMGVANLGGIMKLDLYNSVPRRTREEVLQEMESWKMPEMRLVETEQTLKAMGILEEDVIVQEGEPIVFQEMTMPTSFEGFADVLERDKLQREIFAQQFQQELPEMTWCRCGHAEDAHRMYPEQMQKRYGRWHCVGEGPRECDCGGFIAAGEDSEHMQRCGACDLTFDRRELDQVLAHQHAGLREATGIIGRKL